MSIPLKNVMELGDAELERGIVPSGPSLLCRPFPFRFYKATCQCPGAQLPAAKTADSSPPQGASKLRGARKGADNDPIRFTRATREGSI